MDLAAANILGALSLAVIDRVEDGARRIVGRGGESSAALVVIGYGPGMTNERLRRVLALSHSGAVRLVDRLVSDGLVERRPGNTAREIALHLTPQGVEARAQLLASRLDALSFLLNVLDPEETALLGDLMRKVLSRLETSEQDRFTLCRMCDGAVCSRCPLPTSVSHVASEPATSASDQAAAAPDGTSGT